MRLSVDLIGELSLGLLSSHEVPVVCNIATISCIASGLSTTDSLLPELTRTGSVNRCRFSLLTACSRHQQSWTAPRLRSVVLSSADIGRVAGTLPIRGLWLRVPTRPTGVVHRSA